MSTRTISATSLPSFRYPNIGATRTGTCGVTSASTAVTFSTALAANLRGKGGFQIQLSSTFYYVSRVADNGLSLTLTSAYVGSTNAALAYTLYPCIALRFFVSHPFTPSGASYIVQSGNRGSKNWYKEYLCTVYQGSVYLPEMVLDATNNITVSGQENPVYYPVFTTLAGTKIRDFSGFPNGLVVPSGSTSTTWDVLTQVSNPIYAPRPDGTTLSAAQIDALVDAATAIDVTTRTIAMGSSGGTALDDSALSQDLSGNVTASAGLAVATTFSASGEADLVGGFPSKTAAQIAALTPAVKGRRFYQTDGVKGFYEDYGSSVGIRRASMKVTAYEIGLVPNSSGSASANQTAYNAFHAAAPASGACLQFPEGDFYFTTGLANTKPMQIIGAGANFSNQSTPVAGTRLIVNNGSSGITFTGQFASKGALVRDLNLKTVSGYSGQTTGYGIWSDCVTTIKNAAIEGFAIDGVHLAGTTASSQNSDFSRLDVVHVFDVKRDGIHLGGGGDTNVVLVTLPNVSRAGRHGIYNAGSANTFIACHVNTSGVVNNITATTSGSITASGSPQNVTLSNLTNISVGSFLLVDTGGTQEIVKVTALPGGSQVTAIFSQNHSSGVAVVEACVDYMEKGSSNIWINPYSEGGATSKFYFDLDSTYCTVLGGLFGVPTFVANALGIYNGHFILDRGHLRDLNLKDTTDASSGHDYRLYSRSGVLWAGGLQLQDLTASKIVMSYEPTNERTHLPNVGIAGVVLATGTPQTLTGAGAVNLTTAITYLVTTGANALTLADGTQGQVKTIRMKTDGGDGTLTPTNRDGYATITFNDVGDTVTLQFLDSKWCIIGYYGVTIA